MISIFFNLLVNSTFSLIVGLCVVSFFIWFFRIETGRWKLFLLSLPFAKLIFDFARGIPANSVLLTNIDPFTLPPHSQMFTVSAGATQWGPYLTAGFSLLDFSDQKFTASVGDYLLIWLMRNFGPAPLITVTVAVLGVSLFLLVRRAYHIWIFEAKRRKDRMSAMSLAQHQQGIRTIDIYISEGYSGSPFTGGLLRPYICIPRSSATLLTPPELEAVIAHETAHVRSLDLLWTQLIQILGDLFWFVPGYHWLSRKIDALLEILADRAAVRMGASAEDLAASLLRLQPTIAASPRLLFPAFFRSPSLLKSRIEWLLNPDHEPPPRWGWQLRPFRAIVAVWILLAVLFSTFGGNHADTKTFNVRQISLSKDILIANV